MENKTKTFSKTLNMLNIVGLKESIQALMKKESKYVPVATVCKEYLKKLDEGAHEEEICEDFVNELSKVAVHESAKDVLFNLSTKMNEHKRDISLVKSLYSLQRGQYGYLIPMIESSIVEYMTNKNSETRAAVRQTLALFEGIKEVNDISEALSFDEYEEKTNKVLVNSSLNESMIPHEEVKTYTQDELDKIVAEEKAKAINESANPEHKSIKDIDTHINLDATIKNILKNSTNESLKVYCEQYMTALNSGKAEETLYESFISGLSKWNYLSAVDTEMSALTNRIDKYQQDIDLKKILKLMEGTGSYYIVPLIEGVVADYMANKSMSNKAVLKQRLQAFEYDPFVRDILNVVILDQSLPNTVYLGDSVEKLNNYVHTEKVFSPVQYVKENECIFNVKGTYYNRKGNNITKLSKQSIANLDESFKTLCNLVNHPAIKIDELANTISIYEGKDSAKISETSIILNGEEKTTDEIEKIAEMSHLMNEHKEGFYLAIKMINENFNKIAYIDFVKRVSMNESNGKSADVFRVKNNLFVTTSDAALGTSTFYRNANPIQCRNYINEHMGINVSPLFQDILPNQKAILEGIEDTKKSYENYLGELTNQKAEFERMKDTSDDVEEIDSAIKAIDDEIDEVKKKYDEFQKDSEKFVSGDTDDASTESPDDVAADTEDQSEPETPAEMEEPIEKHGDAVIDTIVNVYEDPEQAAIDSATPYDSDFDVLPANNDKSEVKVLRISYADNIKTGKKSNNGTAYIVIPSVNANGDIKDEIKTVTFYLDADRKPIINNDYMPLMVYNSIVNAIAEDPDTEGIDVEGTATELDVPTSVDVPEYNDSLDTDDAALTEPTEDSVEDDAMFGLGSEDEDTYPTDDDTAELNSFLGSDDDEPADSSANTPVDAVDQEAPAETQEKSEEETYPIELGLDVKDIRPITKESFMKACKEMCIECSMVEGEEDGVTLHFADKSAVFALKDYFQEWKNFSQAQFVSFFPELERCFHNKCSTIQYSPTTQPAKPLDLGTQATPHPLQFSESVKDNFILGVDAINESNLYNDNAKGRVTIVLPLNEAYSKVLGIPENKTKKFVKIQTENVKETEELYEKLVNLKSILGDELDANSKKFIERYKDDFKRISESNVINLNVPYNNFLEQKLAAKGIQVLHINENMNISLKNKSEVKSAKRIFKSVYGDSAPVEVRDFFQLSEGLMNEGVKIRIEDTKTGKVVELDTDEDEDDKKSSSDPDIGGAIETDPFKDVNTTFHSSDNALLGSDVDSSDEAEEKEKKDEEESSDEKSESDDKSENGNSEDEEKKDEPKKEDKKRKFKFKPKRKTDESLKVQTSAQSLNESKKAGIKQPNVLDFVTIPGGQSGQVIAKLPVSGNFIVNVNGHTVEVPEDKVEMINEIPDTLESPYKFDPKTLKGLFEQHVHCGMFINENQITPNNTFVKYSDYVSANENDEIPIYIDGQRTLANRKYIRVMEEVNDFANINDYIEGEEISAEKSPLRNILFNFNDYRTAEGSATPVRVLVKNDEGDYSLIYLPAGSIKPVEM